MALLCYRRPLHYNHAKETDVTAKKLNHLLIITPGFPTDELDTSCIPSLQQFVLNYKKLYPELHITVLSLHYPFHKSKYKWHGLDAFSLQGQNKSGFRRAITICKAYRKMLSIHRKCNINAVLSIWVTDAAYAGKLAARRLHVPFFAWAWGQDVKPGNKYLKLITPKSEEIAVLSDFQNEILLQSYGFNAKYVIPNAITEEAFPVFNTGRRDIDLLAVGSLIPLKQYHLFIELVKWYKENIQSSVTAVLTGDGILKGELLEISKQYGLNENITFTGSVSHNQVLDLMNNAKLFVHPSMYEGHSTVLLEALYSGCKTMSFVPVSARNVNNFTHCKNLDEMKSAIKKYVLNKQTTERVLYNTWKQNVVQIHTILQSML